MLDRAPSETIIVFPEGLSRLSKKFLSCLDIDVDYLCDATNVGDIDYLVLLDTNSLSQLSEKLVEIARKTKIVIIDHHLWRRKYPENTVIAIVDKTYLSTSSIVYDLAKKEGHKFNKNILTLLLGGILYDTKRLSLLNSKVLRLVANILDEGGDYATASRLLRHEMDISEKIARFKASQRVKVYRIGDLLIAATRVDAFEASVARLFLEMGADVAVVVSQQKRGKVRVIARSSPEFFKRTKISLGSHIMPVIGEIIQGEGGGHDTAGGAQGVYDADRLVELVVKIIVEKIVGQQIDLKIIEVK